MTFSEQGGQPLDGNAQRRAMPSTRRMSWDSPRRAGETLQTALSTVIAVSRLEECDICGGGRACMHAGLAESMGGIVHWGCCAMHQNISVWHELGDGRTMNTWVCRVR